MRVKTEVTTEVAELTAVETSPVAVSPSADTDKQAIVAIKDIKAIVTIVLLEVTLDLTKDLTLSNIKFTPSQKKRQKIHKNKSIVNAKKKAKRKKLLRNISI